MNGTLRILISIIVMLLVILVLVIMYGPVEADAGRAADFPVVDRIKMVVPWQNGWAPECRGFEDCVVACFVIATEPPEEQQFAMDCFPYIPRR